ncbi:unnamed protein product, partial [Effrenium voratum]
YGLFLLSRRGKEELAEVVKASRKSQLCEEDKRERSRSDTASTASSDGSFHAEHVDDALEVDASAFEEISETFRAPPGLCDQWATLPLPLRPHLLSLLSSRRSRQRLRLVEQQSGAQLALDHVWNVLHISGSPASIWEAQQQLEVMEGFTVDISCAMWTELMRGRGNEDASPLCLSKVQEQVGHRVHVERDAWA